MKPGFKQTDVGVIPEQWEVVSLSEAASMKSGEGITRAKIDDFSRYPCYGGNGLRGFTKSFTHDGRYALIGRQGALCGNVLAVEGKFFASEHAIVVTALARSDVSWLTFVLGQMRLNRYSESSAQPGLSVSKLLRLKLPIPPSIGEQEAIAESLSDADAFIESLEQLLAKKRDLKQGAMQELLTGTRRLPDFSGVWETRSFDGVLSRLNAKAHQIQTSDYQVTGSYPIVDQGKEPVVGFSDRRDLRFLCPEGGVIVFGDHTCIVKFVDFDFVVGADGTQVLQAKGGQCTRFHAYQLQRRGIAPTGYNRHFKFLKEREFVAPPLPEQIAIATILSSMDAEIAMIEEHIAKARDLKQGMMQELLTGRIRLV